MNKRLLIVIVVAVLVVLCLGIALVAVNVAPLMVAMVTPTSTATLVPTLPPLPTSTPLPPPTPVLPTATAAPTSVNPLDALTAMFRGWSNVKTFRAKATVTPAKGAAQEMTMEVVVPDRFHLTSKTFEAIKIGSTMYMKIGASWQKITLGQNLDFSFGDIKKLESELGTSTDVKFLGAEVLDGTPTLTYQYTVSIKTPTPTTTTSKVWVAVADGLPRRMESTSKNGTKTVVTFYDYNASFTIDAPSK